MKIGEEVYVRGVVDEIRTDVVIIKNNGGYFGTVQQEIFPVSADQCTARWIKDKYGTVICSKCGANRRDNRVGHLGWCNACGAKIVEVQDGENDS